MIILLLRILLLIGCVLLINTASHSNSHYELQGFQAMKNQWEQPTFAVQWLRITWLSIRHSLKSIEMSDLYVGIDSFSAYDLILVSSPLDRFSSNSTWEAITKIYCEIPHFSLIDIWKSLVCMRQWIEFWIYPIISSTVSGEIRHGGYSHF
jgi:hypothetical protein